MALWLYRTCFHSFLDVVQRKVMMAMVLTTIDVIYRAAAAAATLVRLSSLLLPEHNRTRSL